MSTTIGRHGEVSLKLQINPKAIELARQSRNINQTELANQLGCSQSHLSKVELGILVPSEEMVKKLSNILNYPVSFFREEFSIYPVISFHRKRASMTTKSLVGIQAQINVVRLHIQKYMQSVEFDERLPNLSVEDYGSPQKVAQVLRAMWKLPNGPIQNLTEAVESNGGIIIKLDFHSGDVDGVSLRPPNLPPLIFLNKNKSADRTRFNIAHELGHAIMHDIHTPNMEDEANQFAAEFLMPAKDIYSDLQYLEMRNIDLMVKKLGELKRHWKVSMAALARQAKDLEILSVGQYLRLRKRLNDLGYKINEPVLFGHESPKLIKTIVDLHLNELEYSVQELAQVVNLTVDEFTEKYTQKSESIKLKLVRGNKEE